MSDYDFYLEQQQRRRAVSGGRVASLLAPRVTQARQIIDEDAPDGYEDDVRWPPRQPNSTVRRSPAVLPARRERHLPVVRPSLAPQVSAAKMTPSRRGRLHWLVYVGIGMLVVLALWLLFTILGSWWQDTQNDWKYGRPRTFQIDAVVGHHDSAENPSHFIALNLNAQLIIIEFPGGDPTRARVYNGPRLIGPGEDLAPVTLSFRDVTGEGKPDMIATVDGAEIVFINDRGAFRPPRPGEIKPSALSGQQ